MIVKTDKDIISSYLEDHSGLRNGFAESVYLPENIEEIKALLLHAAKNRIPITISGKGTGVTGGRVPFGGIVISLELFNKILEIKRISDNEGSVVVQPSVTVGEVKKAAAGMKLLYAPDPTETSSTIAGNVSTNASGARGFRFGPTRDHVKRLKVMLADGRILDIQRGCYFAKNGIMDIHVCGTSLRFKIPEYKMPDIKNAAGYYTAKGMDLIDLFIGSEGTLGVILEVELKLIKPIREVMSAIVFFRDAMDSLRFSRSVKKEIPNVLSIEYFDSGSLGLLRSDYKNIPADAEAAVFVEMEKDDDEAVIEQFAKAVKTHNSSLDNVWFATSRKDTEGFRKFRHLLPEKVNEIVKKNKFPKVGTDLAVPEDKFFEMYEYYLKEFKKAGMQYLIFGHIGENHFHANILPATEAEFEESREVYARLAGKTVEFNGTISAEHGIGKLKHGFLEIMYGTEALKEMARVKKYFDPACVLNSENIFPKGLLSR